MGLKEKNDYLFEKVFGMVAAEWGGGGTPVWSDVRWLDIYDV